MMDKTDHVRSLNYWTQALEQLEVSLPLLGTNLPGTRVAHKRCVLRGADAVELHAH